MTLSSGVKWAYFQEGDRSSVPLLCLHGGGESKWMWLQKEPIPGVWMIALDRPGYGDSGDPPMKQVEYTFEHILKDIGEFCDKLGIDQFVPCGFSIGTSWAMQAAVYYPKRVRGIILFGTMADTGHPDCPKKLVSKIGKPPKIMDPNGGCLGFILRGAFSGPCKEYQKYNFAAPIKDDAKDPRCATRFQEWMNDPFWVAMKVDDCLGFNRPEALLGDAYRTLFGAWPYDIKQIKCPVYIYPSSFDVDMGSTNPHATTFLKVCGPPVPHRHSIPYANSRHQAVVSRSRLNLAGVCRTRLSRKSPAATHRPWTRETPSAEGGRRLASSKPSRRCRHSELPLSSAA